MFSVLHPITDLGTAERIVAVRPLTAAPPLDLKGQFKFEFNNYLRSALTLRRVSSVREKIETRVHPGRRF
jgi:hypothetical protein